jgi:SAM-dependent methyltransferase
MADTTASAYAFEDRADEDRRLVAQARLFDPSTERLLAAAGIGQGMRVLDLGSGAGNVALLAARAVGPGGSVVGVERDPEAVVRIRRRLVEAGVEHVSVVEGDVQALDAVDGPFDAVVGRLILMYLPDPPAALRRAAALLRPGGVVCMQEADLAYQWCAPATPLWSQVRSWFVETLERAGVEARMGLKLREAFVRAGLPGPRMVMEAFVEGGDEAPSWGWANVVKGIAPLMERLGVTSAAELRPDTLADRLRDECAAVDAVVVGPPMVGAWATVPGW